MKKPQAEEKKSKQAKEENPNDKIEEQFSKFFSVGIEEIKLKAS